MHLIFVVRRTSCALMHPSLLRRLIPILTRDAAVCVMRYLTVLDYCTLAEALGYSRPGTYPDLYFVQLGEHPIGFIENCPAFRHIRNSWREYCNMSRRDRQSLCKQLGRGGDIDCMCCNWMDGQSERDDPHQVCASIKIPLRDRIRKLVKLMCAMAAGAKSKNLKFIGAHWPKRDPHRCIDHPFWFQDEILISAAKSCDPGTIESMISTYRRNTGRGFGDSSMVAYLTLAHLGQRGIDTLIALPPTLNEYRFHDLARMLLKAGMTKEQEHQIVEWQAKNSRIFPDSAQAKIDATKQWIRVGAYSDQ